MLFSSVSFLYLFLPVVLLIYYLVPKRARNYILLAASLLFYFFGEQAFTLLLIFSSISDWLHSLYIEKHRGEASAKYALISSIIINLAMLGFFKYSDFVISIINWLPGVALPLPHIALPIGISFFTFQTMSYTIDVYRGRVKAENNLFTLACFVCLFPQLVAGPIVRYSDISLELQDRSIDINGVAIGIRRFVFGLAKKVLIANSMGELCSVFRSSSEKSVLFYWIYAIAFTLQIYFDFSGYSDMAIGLGKMLGFSFPENFDYPYISRSITEFWRRWHMTLGGWFRDYVYIPLGGNRTTKVKWLRNIAIVWLLTGLWHGASWNFIAWGAFFGVLLIAEKMWFGKYLEKLKVFSHIYVLFAVVLSFVIFNADGLSGAISDIAALFGAAGLPFISAETLYYLKSYAVLMIVAAVGSLPLLKNLYDNAKNEKLKAVLEPLSVVVLLALSTANIVDGSFNPFLYFRF